MAAGEGGGGGGGGGGRSAPNAGSHWKLNLPAWITQPREHDPAPASLLFRSSSLSPTYVTRLSAPNTSSSPPEPPTLPPVFPLKPDAPGQKRREMISVHSG